MIPAELIEKKRDGIELTPEEIDWFISNVMSEKIDDSQLSAFLMSIYFKDMSEVETQSLVHSMVKSGKKFNFKHLEKYVADKHSTGGIGDKTSFSIAPIAAAAGIDVPMIAGRGLGHTGGTIDFDALVSFGKYAPGRASDRSAKFGQILSLKASEEY